jgi:anti-sigma factor RsiW
VKHAHDEGFTCSQFKKLLRDFIDDELHDARRGDFLSHAAACPSCRTDLRELHVIRNALANLPHLSVKPEFDFRLKASIRLESARLGSPLYRLRLFLMENMVSMVGVPAAAALFILAALYYTGLSGTVKTPAPVTSQLQTEMLSRPAFTPAESLDADVNYVLESVELSEEELGNLLVSPSGEISPDTHTISLLSF